LRCVLQWALITSITSDISLVVWSAKGCNPVGNGVVAELMAEGDLVLRSSLDGVVVWSAGSKGQLLAVCQ
jgi:hypothetical protein